MNRAIFVGRNDEMPHDIAQRTLRVCGACDGTGYDYAYPVNPSEKPYQVPCRRCDGEGAIEYSNPGTTPASGGAAVLRFPSNQGQNTVRAQQAQPPLSPAAGLLVLAADTFLTLVGLAAFTAIGFFFWILA